LYGLLSFNRITKKDFERINMAKENEKSIVIRTSKGIIGIFDENYQFRNNDEKLKAKKQKWVLLSTLPKKLQKEILGD
jgi:hypothetical protein